MNKSKRFYNSHPVVILLIGLIIAQAIATIQVYLSNLDLYNTITQVASAGYLAIPNRHAMGSLREFSPAFWGGLFFTSTIGAGIALGAMAAAWIWVHLFLRKYSILFFFGFVWAGLSFLVNRNGFSLMPTLYFLFVAPAVFTLTAKRESIPNSQSDRIRRWVHLIPVPLLALLWFTQFDNSMFLDLRDNLLLSNKYGREFSDFYYTYTLYPAEAFKALNQKSIKTSRINTTQVRSMSQRIGRRLIANDYLPLSDATQVDLTILQNNDYLTFQTDSHHAFQIPIAQFFDDSRNVLLRISEESDRHAKFRQFTYLSLLIGFPVSLYMIMHAVFYYLGHFAMGRNTSALTASIICLLVGISVLFFFQSNRSRNIQIQNISDSLSSNQWQTRVAALKLMAQKKLDIARYRSYPLLQSNQPPQERYWLVRALAFSRRPENYKVLLEYLNDDNLNVRTMALYSLGLRGNPQAIRPIISKIENSNNWYEQMYAYKALRSLGWKQTKSH
jgi:hypothetical protein